MSKESFILENLGEVVLLLNCDLTIAYSNTAKSVNKDQMPLIRTKQTIMDYVHLDDQRRFGVKIHDARAEKGKQYYLKARLHDENASDRWFAFTIKCLSGEDCTEQLLVVGTAIESLRQEEVDTIEREAALRDSEQLGHIGSWWVDLETRRNHWSPGNFALWNVDPIDGPTPFNDLLKKIHPDDSKAIQKAIDRIKETQKTQSLTFRMMNKGKLTRYFLTRISPWYVNGKLKEVKGVNIEITDIIKIQNQLEEKVDELSWQNKKLEKYIFINSHEVRRPMANILGLIDLAKKDNLPVTEIIPLLDQEASLMDALIQKINLTLTTDMMIQYGMEMSNTEVLA